MRRPSGAETGRTLAGHRQSRASGTRVVDSEPYGGARTPAGSRWHKACRLNQVSGYGAMAVMKAKDESSTPVGTSPTAADGPTTEIRDGTDRHRRRLIRGASALPVLLTLRSGGVMAQGSCTGFTVTETIPKGTQFKPAEHAGQSLLKPLNTCEVGGHTKVNEASLVIPSADCASVGQSGKYRCEFEIAVTSLAACNSIVGGCG